MKSGWNAISSPRARSVALRCSSRAPLTMYHWRVETISRGLSPFSKNFTGWLIVLTSPTSSPDAVRASTTTFLAENTVLPAISA